MVGEHGPSWVAETMVTARGTDKPRAPWAPHFVSCDGFSPGQRQSGGPAHAVPVCEEERTTASATAIATDGGRGLGCVVGSYGSAVVDVDPMHGCCSVVMPPRKDLRYQ